MSKEEYAVEVENISKIYTLRNKNNQYKTDKKTHVDTFLSLITFICVHFPPLYCSIAYPVTLALRSHSRVIHVAVVEVTLAFFTAAGGVSALTVV